MTTLTFGNMLFILIIIMMIYTAIDRICRCFEECAKAKAIGKLSMKTKIDINELTKKMEDLKNGGNVSV